MIITKYKPLLTNTEKQNIFTQMEFVRYKIYILIFINPLKQFFILFLTRGLSFFIPLHLLCTSCDLIHLCLSATKNCCYPSFNFFLFEPQIIRDWHGMILQSVTSCEQSFRKIVFVQISLILHVNCIFVAVHSIIQLGGFY